VEHIGLHDELHVLKSSWMTDRLDAISA